MGNRWMKVNPIFSHQGLLFGESVNMNMNRWTRLNFCRNILLTHSKEYFMTWRNIFPCVQRWKKNGWKIIRYEQKDEQNIFTTKSYVSIQTLFIHNREICVNQNTICSFPKGMFPLRIKTIRDYTLFIPFQLYFIWMQSFKPLMSRSILVTWRIKWMKNKNRWTKLVKNKKLFVNPNSTFSQLKGMCQLKHHLFISKRYVPIRNWDNMRSHIIYSTYFLLQIKFSNLLCLGIFLLLE